ncbi:HU family DNA-binding protein [Sunxiuqinia rutila]|uniref:HU family DNA-binding protein n=1 Tax=Sunxiuqinia rutila TaxID=1397841 RepID=UPI003D35A839
MSINYKVIARVNPADREAAPKYYASINSKGQRSHRFIAHQIAERSSLNEMDILSVIEGFLQIVPETLNDGYTVDLGDFGSMGLTAKSQATEQEDAFNASHIEGAKVLFRPGKLFKTALKTAEFVKMEENGQ